jgi:DNA-binding transcriptional ArsR family regulator
MLTTMVLRVGQADLLACRFATSPLFETMTAARVFASPRSQAYVMPWWREVGAGPPPAAELRAVQPARGHTPDFLSPPPAGPTTRFADQLALVRATPPENVAAELARTRADQQDTAARRIIDRLIGDPAAARDLLAEALEDAWERLVAPWWPRLRELLDADITYRSRLLADHGLGPVVAELHERVSWADGAIVVRDMSVAEERPLDGQGLVLMPSAFMWPGLGVVSDRPWQPTVIYPARGIGELWRDRTAPAALARLLGRTRALLLSELVEPAATTALAERYGLSPGGVSAHLAALYDAGLVGKGRHRHEVRYRRTPLGDAVVTGVLPED